jgi:hypothetical protein
VSIFTRIWRAIFGGKKDSELRALAANDPRVLDAMAYARKKTKRIERMPARWYAMKGHAQDAEGWWYRNAQKNEPDACGKCQTMSDHFRVIIYVNPQTWDGQHRDAWQHEAGHTMQRAAEPGHTPKAWSKHFARW